MQAIDLGTQVLDINKPRNRLFCRLDGQTPSDRVKNRLKALNFLGLLTSESIPPFEEATQKAARFLEAPICILGLGVGSEFKFKSTFGLSSNDLMSQLVTNRQIPLEESFGSYVLDSEQPLVIEDTIANSVFTSSSLTQHYGIRAYLGVPLVNSDGLCIGALEIMDTVPRQFSIKDIEFLTLTARCSLRELERDRALKLQKQELQNQAGSIESTDSTLGINSLYGANPKHTATKSGQGNSDIKDTNLIKVKLLAQLTQELRTPLTSVIGMASVLRRGVYGSLTDKQSEYLEIIHDSGQNLISLVDEIVNLGVLGNQDKGLNKTSVDIEMICQQAINSLVDIGKQHQQSLRLSVEPGNRIWVLDKEKVKQALYYLVVSVLEMSESGGEVRIHVSRRDQALNIAVWLSHPWLGDGLTQLEFYSRSVTKALAIAEAKGLQNSFDPGVSEILPGNRILTTSALMEVINLEKQNKKGLDSKANERVSRDVLGLLFACHLTELHQGRIIVQGAPESGYRYIIQVPKLTELEQAEA